MATRQLFQQFYRKFGSKCQYLLMSSKCTGSLHTAGIIVIGDEILKGQIIDTNTKYLATRLYSMGIKVGRISVLPDNVALISSEIKEFSGKFTYVITTGGIGPTHDDVTYEAVAHAFDDQLVLNSELFDILCEFNKNIKTEPLGKKLAYIPKTAKLTYGYDKTTGAKSKFPNVSVRNVYMFPGIPNLLETLFSLVAENHFGGSGIKFHYRELYLNLPEVDIVTNLNDCVKEFPSVTFGSYPELYHSYYKVKITIESIEENLTKIAFQKLTNLFTTNVVSYDPKPLENLSKKIDHLFSIAPAYMKISRNTITEVLNSANQLCLWIDTQIESTVLIHLCYASCVDQPNKKIILYYFPNSKLFDELEKYISETNNRYSVTAKRLCNMQEEYLTQVFRNKTLLVGKDLTMSESVGCTIVNPIKQWTTNDLWFFIRGLSLPYCKVHDEQDAVHLPLNVKEPCNKEPEGGRRKPA